MAYRISFEVSFGEGSPYAEKFPSLYDLSYDQSEAISRDVGGHTVHVAAEVTGVTIVGEEHGPGIYQSYPPQPSLHASVLGAPDEVTDFADSLGYLLQQTEVWITRENHQGNRLAMDLYDPALGDREFAVRFWDALQNEAPTAIMQGAQPILSADGIPGLRIIQGTDDEGMLISWSQDEVDQFLDAVGRVSDRLGFDVDVQNRPVDLTVRKHDWKAHSDGNSFLQSLEGRGRSHLAARLHGELGRATEAQIEEAFQRHAPDALRAGRSGE